MTQRQSSNMSKLTRGKPVTMSAYRRWLPKPPSPLPRNSLLQLEATIGTIDASQNIYSNYNCQTESPLEPDDKSSDNIGRLCEAIECQMQLNDENGLPAPQSPGHNVRRENIPTSRPTQRPTSCLQQASRKHETSLGPSLHQSTSSAPTPYVLFFETLLKVQQQSQQPARRNNFTPGNSGLANPCSNQMRLASYQPSLLKLPYSQQPCPTIKNEPRNRMGQNQRNSISKSSKLMQLASRSRTLGPSSSDVTVTRNVVEWFMKIYHGQQRRKPIHDQRRPSCPIQRSIDGRDLVSFVANQRGRPRNARTSVRRLSHRRRSLSTVAHLPSATRQPVLRKPPNNRQWSSSKQSANCVPLQAVTGPFQIGSGPMSTTSFLLLRRPKQEPQPAPTMVRARQSNIARTLIRQQPTQSNYPDAGSDNDPIRLGHTDSRSSSPPLYESLNSCSLDDFNDNDFQCSIPTPPVTRESPRFESFLGTNKCHTGTKRWPTTRSVGKSNILNGGQQRIPYNASSFSVSMLGIGNELMSGHPGAQTPPVSRQQEQLEQHRHNQPYLSPRGGSPLLV